MKTNRSTIIIIAVTLIVGMALGGIIFRGESNASIAHEHVNEEGVWTCSMHPQVRQSEPGSCPFCGMDLIPLNNQENNDPRVLTISEEAIALANIQTTIIGKSEMEGEISLNGKVSIDQRAVHSQTTHFGGRIENLYKNFEGEEVRKGDPIASIFSPELVAAQEEFLQAKRVANSNPTLFEAAKKKLRYWKISEEQIKEIEKRNMPLQEIELLAEFDGILLKKHVNNGDHLKEGQTLMEIVDLSKLWIVFDVYEKDIDLIKLGQTISFTRNGSSENFNASVSFIYPNVNPTTRVIAVRADFNNRGQQLKPDMFVKGSLKRAGTQQLTIPRSAVLWTGQRSVVYVKLDGELAFQMVEIELGSKTGNQYTVLSGLDQGDEVVTNGAFTLDAEAQLQGKNSMMLKVSQQQITQPAAFVEIELGETPDYQSGIDPKFQDQLWSLVSYYLELKDAMVEGNTRNIWNTTPSVSKALEGVDMSLVKAEAHDHWMTVASVMEISLNNIQSSSDRDHQRLEFINLSKALINALRAYGINQNVLIYVQFCPMANQNQGATWISKEENIINPYFGDAMLTCGSVEETLNSMNK